MVTKFRIPEIILGAMLAVAIFAMGTVFSLSPHSTSGGNNNQSSKQRATENGGQSHQAKSLWIPEDSTSFFTIWIAGFTGVLALGTLLLWWSTRGLQRVTNETIKLAREEFHSTHRPKVRVKHLFLTSDICQEKPVIVHLWLVNNGTSEATLGEIGIRYYVVQKDRTLPIEPRITPAFNLTGNTLMSGINFEVPSIDIGKVLTADETSAIQNGRAILYCVGYVSYLDGAGRIRITGFCRVLTFPSSAIFRASNCRFMKFDDPDYEYED